MYYKMFVVEKADSVLVQLATVIVSCSSTAMGPILLKLTIDERRTLRRLDM